MSRHQSRLVAARALRDRLKAEGRTDDARVIDQLCRSSAVSAGLNKSLQSQLRDLIAGAKKAAPPAKVEPPRPMFFERPGLAEFELDEIEAALPSEPPPFGPGRWA